MYSAAVAPLAGQAGGKVAGQKLSLASHLVRSMMAGMYVGAAIVLIFTVGSFLPVQVQKLLMGVCFGGALTIVIFAGSELFTGSNLVLTLGVFTGKARWRDLFANWGWTWIGNLMGSVLLAWMVIQSGVMSMEPVQGFVLRIVETKMNLPIEQLFWRAVLANWMVCLGVWMAARIKSETARILIICWCMFTFITCPYEHCVPKIVGLILGYLLPDHGTGITFGGYWYNLGLATLGNVVGGAVFVGLLYWIGSPKARESAASPI